MVPSNTYSIRCLTLPADAPVLEAVGCLRVAVWAAAGALDAARFPTGQWLDADDAHARHWVAESPTGELVAAARLVWHADPLRADRDVAVWLGAGRPLPFPCVDLGRLVVRPDWQRRGVATALNAARVAAARAAGARAAIATASASNARLLLAAAAVRMLLWALTARRRRCRYQPTPCCRRQRQQDQQWKRQWQRAWIRRSHL